MAILNPVAHPILVHGHRGARALFPENTLPAFEYAIAAGADALELDVAVTRDDIVVVAHDPTLDRRPIRELTCGELQQWRCGTKRHPLFPRQAHMPGVRIPTLDQVLDLAGRGHFLFNIEIKSFPRRPRLTPPPEHFAELVWHAIRRHRLQHRVMVQSFDFRTLHAMRRLAPDLPLGALYSRAPRSFPSIAHRAGADIVAPHHLLVSARRVRAAHAAGLRVITWTANHPRQWKRLIAARVDAIITDHPAALITYLREHGLRQ